MSGTTISITPDGALTITVDGEVVSTPVQDSVQDSTPTQAAGTLTQGGLYRSATGRTWLYDPQGDSYTPWVRVLDKHGRHDSSLVGKRYADTADNITYPLVSLTEGATVQR